MSLEEWHLKLTSDIHMHRHMCAYAPLNTRTYTFVHNKIKSQDKVEDLTQCPQCEVTSIVTTKRLIFPITLPWWREYDKDLNVTSITSDHCYSDLHYYNCSALAVEYFMTKWSREAKTKITWENTTNIILWIPESLANSADLVTCRQLTMMAFIGVFWSFP